MTSEKTEYSVEIYWWKPVQNHYQTITLRAEDIEDATNQADIYCRILLDNSMPSNIYELRWNFEGLSQGHYITDWNKATAKR
jgi:hypothetical protein